MKYTERGSIALTVELGARDVQIKISDTGIGISDIDMPRLFKPFERMESHLQVIAGGTGLGLYLTKKIVTELLQGEIGAKSTLGEGSIFWLKIPYSIGIQNNKE